MALRHPTRSFTIPSLYDGVSLECRLYHPSRLPDTQQSLPHGLKAAILAHPYAPLGGCFDDPVVCAAGEELLKMGWVVGTFNLRGAGESGGRTSWTAKPELGDYISFYGFMVHYLFGLKAASSAGTNTTDEEASRPRLLLSGYSYGSMLASYLPPIQSVLDLFASSAKDGPAREINLCAMRLSASDLGRNDTDSHAKEPVQITGDFIVDVSYLLISPILPPVAFLIMLSLPTSRPHLDTVLQGKPIKSGDPTESLTSHKSLAIYGSNDTFTSAKKLRKWCEELAHARDSRFEHREIEGAGHFWHEGNAECEMGREIREWASTP